MSQNEVLIEKIMEFEGGCEVIMNDSNMNIKAEIGGYVKNDADAYVSTSLDKFKGKRNVTFISGLDKFIGARYISTIISDVFQNYDNQNVESELLVTIKTSVGDINIRLFNIYEFTGEFKKVFLKIGNEMKTIEL